MSCCPSSLMKKFLGVFFLAIGVVMLWNYSGVMQMVMDEGNRARAMAPFLHEYLVMFVGYTWPFVALFIGVSYLTCFKKCWASMLLYAYMLTFVLGHMWAGNMQTATFALLVVTFAAITKCASSMGMMMCEMGGKKK